MGRRAYLGIGSNLGDRGALLQGAVDALAGVVGLRLVAVSPVYETAPVGGPPQPNFLNAVVAVDTELTPRELLELAQGLGGFAKAFGARADQYSTPLVRSGTNTRPSSARNAKNAFLVPFSSANRAKACSV